MHFKDIKLIEKTLDNLSIDLDDEFKDLDFYKKKKSKYNYIKRKYDKNYMKSGYYVGLYENDVDNYEKRGYFYVQANLTTKQDYIYPSFTRYFELLEFGFNNNDLKQVQFLIDYLYYYCRTAGGTFLKIKTKEKEFTSFYELIKKFKHTIKDDYIYLDLDPLDYEMFKHLVIYENDKLTIKDLYFLLSMGFDIYKDICQVKIGDNKYIEINRKTKEVTYPSNVINIPSKYLKLNKDSYALIYYIISQKNDVKDQIMDLGYRLEGYDYELVKIGKKLLTFNDFKNVNSITIRDNFEKFAIKAYRKYNFISLDIFKNVYFKYKMFYAHYSLEHVYLPKYANEKIEESNILKKYNELFQKK